MSHDQEFATVRERMQLQAEQVACLMDLVGRLTASGRDASLAEEKLAVLEASLWRQHRRLSQLKQSAKAAA
jgi:hypothetical protein